MVHSGPAQLVLQPLAGGAPTRTVKLPGSPDAILSTPDRSKAFLLDSSRGDVIPVNLVSGQVGAAIPVGKLPTDEDISANGATLYVTDNLGGTVIPINTATDQLEPAQPLSQGVDFYVPSPTTSGALVGAVTSPGQPGVVYFYNPGTGTGSPVAVGSNPVDAAFYSPDGTTVWVVEAGLNSKPGSVIPIAVATRKPGTPIKLGIAPGAYALTPNGQTLVIANGGDSTVSIVDLVKRLVVATVPVGATPTGLDIDKAGTTAWVASATEHKLVPINLLTNHAGSAISLGNAPGRPGAARRRRRRLGAVSELEWHRQLPRRHRGSVRPLDPCRQRARAAHRHRFRDELGRQHADQHRAAHRRGRAQRGCRHPGLSDPGGAPAHA